MSELPYTIENNETIGRFVISSKDLEPGYEILSETPFSVGPKVDSTLLCLGCYCTLPLESDNIPSCSNCRWPLCVECSKSSSHHHVTLECSIFKKAGVEFSYESPLGPQLECITPLRTLLTIEKEPEKWKSEISTMQHHSEERQMHSSVQWEAEGVNVVKFLRDKCGLASRFSEKLIRQVCGILEVNCFEIAGSLVSVPVRGLYYLTALLSHNCVANTVHSIDCRDQFRLRLRTTVEVRNGQELFSSYTEPLLPTTLRRAALFSSKYFKCECARCSDPTELGTHLNSLKCPSCDNGLILTSKPLDDQADWKCTICDRTLTSEMVHTIYNKIKRDLDFLEQQDDEPEKLGAFEKLYRGLRSSLHPHHSFMITLMHSLVFYYGHIEGYSLDMLPDILLERKVELTTTVLNVLDKIEPGMTRTRARLLYEQHVALMLLSRSRLSSGSLTKDQFKSELNAVAAALEESSKIFALEPEGSTEKETSVVAFNSLNQLRASMSEL